MKIMAKETDLALDKPGGFDVDIVNQMLSKETITCSICLLVLKEPVQAVPCGHRFCKSCIDLEMERLEPEELTCPNDRKKISVFPDIGKQREIYNFKVQCSNGGPSKCQWDGELRSYEEHLKQCYFQVLECEKECGQKDILRKDMPIHLDDECPKNLLDCAFSSIGCQFKGKVKELRKHQKNFAVQHLFLEGANHSARISSLEKDLSNERDENAKLKAKVLESEIEMTQLKRKNTEDVEKLERELASQFKQKCPFTFNIKNVSMAIKKNYDFRISSDTFEFLNGYRGRLQVAFNKTRKNNIHFFGKKFIGVYFQIMKGPYDDILEWPMSFGEISLHCFINGASVCKSSFKCRDAKNRFTKPSSFAGGMSRGFPTFLDQARDLDDDQDEIDIVVDVMSVDN